MKRVGFTSSFLCAAVFVSGASGVRMLAQLPANAVLYASGLEGPRGLAFGPDGTLYVAEAGLGGKTSTVGSCPQVPGPVGPYTGGLTARISKVDTKGNVTTVVSGLPSSQDAMARRLRGRGRVVSERGSVCGAGWRRVFAWKYGFSERRDQGEHEDGELDECGEYEPGVGEISGEVHEPGRL